MVAIYFEAPGANARQLRVGKYPGWVQPDFSYGENCVLQ